MNQDKIIFQMATDYLPKIALRIESLYKTIEEACQETHPVIHHCAIINLLEIIRLIEKPELKSRFLKEFMRVMHNLHKVNDPISHILQEKIQGQIQTLSHEVGRFGEVILQNPFLQSINSTSSSYSYDNEMNSPQLLLWLESQVSLRLYDLNEWLKGLKCLYATAHLYLTLFRESARFDSIEKFNGFYQRQLPPKASCYLILFRIDKTFGIIPKMQLGHYGLSLRLFEIKTMREIQKTDAKLDLAICQL